MSKAKKYKANWLRGPHIATEIKRDDAHGCLVIESEAIVELTDEEYALLHGANPTAERLLPAHVQLQPVESEQEGEGDDAGEGDEQQDAGDAAADDLQPGDEVTTDEGQKLVLGDKVAEDEYKAEPVQDVGEAAQKKKGGKKAAKKQP